MSTKLEVSAFSIFTGLIRSIASRGAPLALLLGTGFITGCSTGSSLTGGGVPVGSTRAEFSGEAVLASNQDQPVAGATVILTAADGSTFTTRTDSSGKFDFPSVPIGPASVRITPAIGSSLREAQLPIKIDAQAQQATVAALLPDAPNLSLTGIGVTPPSLSVRVGEKAKVRATLLGSNIPAGLEPSWTVSGGVGRILPHGQFLATHAGTGSIAAQLGGFSASIPVTVQ